MANDRPASYGQCILVLDRGFVFYADHAAKNDTTGLWLATNARCIRRWGTDKGLAQLVHGPLPQTSLDATAPALEISPAALLFVIPCTGDWSE